MTNVTNVWAYRLNQGFVFDAWGGEWNLSVGFTTLPNLVEQLKKATIAKGQLRKLAVVVHGDSGGLLQLQEGNLTASTAGRYSKDLQAIRDYLWTNARVIFYSCIAGRGEGGTALLKELSKKYFPGRHVIGFERFGKISDARLATVGGQAPGAMWCGKSTVPTDPGCDPPSVVDKPTSQILSEYSIYAKWSYRGEIIKKPHDEIVQEIVLENARVIPGPREVEQALKDPSTRAKLNYIAIKTKDPSDEIQRLFNDVQKPPYRFLWGAPAWKLRELDLKKLPRTSGMAPLPANVAIVAVIEKKVTHKYKCAWKDCQGHKEVQQYCRPFVEGIPNGPLSPAAKTASTGWIADPPKRNIWTLGCNMASNAPVRGGQVVPSRITRS